jgi:hypothetical protein
LAAFFSLAAAQGQHEAITAEIVSKRFSSGYFPVAGSYVEYEFRLTNTGNVTLEDQSLWVSLVSEGNKTHSYAKYSVSLLEPGGSKTLHLGPFKMEEEGWYHLQAGMDGVVFDFQPSSFMVYRQDTTLATFVAIPLIIAGAGIVAFSLYLKRKRGCMKLF